MPNISTLKKSLSDIEKLNKALDTATGVQSNEWEPDPRFWFPVQDKAGNATATIRFLPAPPIDGEDGVAQVSYKHYKFKGPTGKEYRQRSRTTFKGEKDPVAELNSILFNTSEDKDHPARKQAYAQRQTQTFISNILVVKDPATPENEGKVFLFRYGPTINEMIEAKRKPQFEDDKPIVVFDPWNGLDFRLVITKQGSFNNYDKSSFAQTPSAIGDDEYIDTIWNSEYSLKAEVAPDKFKSYDELKAILESVLGTAQGTVGNTGPSVSPSAVETPKPLTLEDLNTVTDEEDPDLKAYQALINN